MTIIYMHGVNTRTAQIDPSIESALRRHVVPEISQRPDEVPIEYAYWGDVAARFAWNGESRRRTPLLGMGAGDVNALSELVDVDENPLAAGYCTSCRSAASMR